MISIEYVRTLESEVIRKNRQSMWPIWCVAFVMLWAGGLAMFEHHFPRVDRFITTEIR